MPGGRAEGSAPARANTNVTVPTAAITHKGVIRPIFALATGWNMATPMPDGLDVSKALILNLAEDGAPSLHAMNVDLSPRTA